MEGLTNIDLKSTDTCPNCCGDGCEACANSSEEEEEYISQDSEEDPQEQEQGSYDEIPEIPHTVQQGYVGAQSPLAEKQPFSCPNAPTKRRKTRPIRYEGPDMLSTFFAQKDIPLERAVKLCQAWVGYNKLIVKETSIKK